MSAILFDEVSGGRVDRGDCADDVGLDDASLGDEFILAHVGEGVDTCVGHKDVDCA